MKINDATMNSFSYYREKGKYFKENRRTKEAQETSRGDFEKSLAIARQLIDAHRGDFESARREAEQITGGLAG